MRLSLDHLLNLEEATSEAVLRDQLTFASTPSFGYYFMLTLSASIATFGLIANSAPAIIGAMIIAPLMSPIVGLSFAAAVGGRRLVTSSIVSILTGTALVIGVSYVGAHLAEVRIVGSEIVARTAPTTLDLGVALCAGAAAAFAHARVSIANSIAGVAIAVALVPPLAVCGIGLALGDKGVAERGASLADIGLKAGGVDVAAGAATLFLTNIVGITGVALAVFLFQRYGSWKRALLMVLSVVGIGLLLYGPLDRHFHDFYIKSRVLREFAKLRQQEIVAEASIINDVQVKRIDGELHVLVSGLAPRDHVPTLGTNARAWRQALSLSIGEPVTLEISVVPVDVMTIVAGPAAEDPR